MLVRDAFLAYAHYLAIFALACVLLGELFLLRRTLPGAFLDRLLAIDRWYGIIAAVVIATGLCRVFLGIKPAGFYGGNLVFWVKMGLFACVGLVSIVPTIAYLGWNKRRQPDGSLVLDDAEYERVRGLVFLQVCLFVFIPLCAVFMARGL
jgi:putative membrane protein